MLKFILVWLFLSWLSAVYAKRIYSKDTILADVMGSECPPEILNLMLRLSIIWPISFGVMFTMQIAAIIKKIGAIDKISNFSNKITHFLNKII